MKIIHCDDCKQLVFYENVRCVNREYALAYLPDLVVRVIGFSSADSGKSQATPAAGRNKHPA